MNKIIIILLFYSSLIFAASSSFTITGVVPPIFKIEKYILNQIFINETNGEKVVGDIQLISNFPRHIEIINDGPFQFSLINCDLTTPILNTTCLLKVKWENLLLTYYPINVIIQVIGE